MKPRLPLNNLNTFATAAELSSFQAAAEVLHVTPSAVSHQIRNLESLLGYELFERLDKRVKLTSRGERLFAELREPFRDIYKASESALHICQGNELSLSVAPAFATRWLLPRLESFYSAYPEIKLSLTATSDVVNFYRDDVDAAIRLGNGDWPGAESIKLFDMELVAVCLPSLLRTYQESDQAGHQNWLTPEQVAQQSLVINSSIPDTWGAWFASAGVELSQPLTGMQVQSASQSLEAIQTGQQICLIDRPFVERELASGQLVQVCDHSHHGNRSYYLAINQEAVDKVCLQQFRDWLLNLCR